MYRARISAVLAALLLLAPLRVSTLPASAATGSDLSVTKVADRTTARVGDSVTYTITLTNNGPKKAVGVMLGEGAPDQLGVTSFDCGGGEHIPQGAFTCRYDRLARGETVTATFAATVTPDASPGTEVSNLAEAYFERCPDRSCGDRDYGNNSGTATITIVEERRLQSELA
jgi:uncharacterized repeat protein (TIGR01451 family)